LSDKNFVYPLALAIRHHRTDFLALVHQQMVPSWIDIIRDRHFFDQVCHKLVDGYGMTLDHWCAFYGSLTIVQTLGLTKAKQWMHVSGIHEDSMLMTVARYPSYHQSIHTERKQQWYDEILKVYPETILQCNKYGDNTLHLIFRYRNWTLLEDILNTIPAICVLAALVCKNKQGHMPLYYVFFPDPSVPRHVTCSRLHALLFRWFPSLKSFQYNQKKTLVNPQTLLWLDGYPYHPLVHPVTGDVEKYNIDSSVVYGILITIFTGLDPDNGLSILHMFTCAKAWQSFPQFFVLYSKTALSVQIACEHLSRDGQTILMMACKSNIVHRVQYILHTVLAKQYGISIKDKNGDSCIEYCDQESTLDIIRQAVPLRVFQSISTVFCRNSNTHL